MAILYDWGSDLRLTVSLLNHNWRCAVVKEQGDIRDILIKNGTIEKR